MLLACLLVVLCRRLCVVSVVCVLALVGVVADVLAIVGGALDVFVPEVCVSVICLVRLSPRGRDQ